MNDENFDELDQRLGNYLKVRLNPQLGRSEQRFLTVAGTPGRRRFFPFSSHSTLFWSIAASGIAASLFLAAMLAFHFGHSTAAGQMARSVETGGEIKNKQIPADAHVISAPNTGIAVSPAATPTLVGEEQSEWQIVNAGTVVLDDNTPARQYIRERMTYAKYTDPKTGVTTEVAAPEREVVVVAMDAY